MHHPRRPRLLHVQLEISLVGLLQQPLRQQLWVVVELWMEGLWEEVQVNNS